MPNNPGRPLAPHVRAAIAQGQGAAAQPRMGETALSTSQGRPMAAHVQHAIAGMHVQTAMVAVRTPQTVILMKPCPECGKKKGHLSSCSRHPNQKKSTAKKVKKVHQENQSWTNLKAYRPGWVSRNGITETDVKQFVKQYSARKIRGHASGDNSQGEQGNTTTDLNAFKSWYTTNYGWVG